MIVTNWSINVFIWDFDMHFYLFPYVYSAINYKAVWLVGLLSNASKEVTVFFKCFTLHNRRYATVSVVFLCRGIAGVHVCLASYF